MSAPSPARLSSISSSLLTSILSLARLKSSPIPVPVPPSLTSSIRKQWIQLDQGIQSLEDEIAKKEGVDPSEERVVEELKDQCERLRDLAGKEGVDGLESVRREKKLWRGNERAEVQPDSSRSDSPLSHPPRSPLSTPEFPVPRQPSPPPTLPVSPQPSRPFTNLLPRPPSPYTSSEDDSSSRRRDEENMRRANEDLRMIQDQMINEQDRTLDQLSEAVSRQKHISLHISEELDNHMGLLEETDGALDSTDARLRRARNRLDFFAKKSKQHLSMCTILGLITILLAILILIK